MKSSVKRAYDGEADRLASHPVRSPGATVFFFFGSLMDRDVLSIVLGRSVAHEEYVAATLPGYRRICVDGESYPALVESAEPTDCVTGYAMALRNEDEVSRVIFFESEEYAPQETLVLLEDGSSIRSFLCIAKPHCPLRDAPWDFSRWQRETKALFLPLAEGYMHMNTGRHTDEEIEAEWQRLKREFGV